MVLDQAEDLFHLPLIVDVLGKDVFVERIAGRTVHVQEAVLAAVARQLAQEVPPLGVVGRIAARALQLVAGPEDRPLGPGVETLGIEQRALIVIAQQADVAAHHQIDALARIRAVADDVAQAIHLGDALLLDIRQNRLEGFEVAVDIADQCALHAGLDSRQKALQPRSAPRQGTAKGEKTRDDRHITLEFKRPLLHGQAAFVAWACDGLGSATNLGRIRTGATPSLSLEVSRRIDRVLEERPHGRRAGNKRQRLLTSRTLHRQAMQNQHATGRHQGEAEPCRRVHRASGSRSQGRHERTHAAVGVRHGRSDPLGDEPAGLLVQNERPTIRICRPKSSRINPRMKN